MARLSISSGAAVSTTIRTSGAAARTRSSATRNPAAGSKPASSTRTSAAAVGRWSSSAAGPHGEITNSEAQVVEQPRERLGEQRVLVGDDDADPVMFGRSLEHKRQGGLRTALDWVNLPGGGG